MNWQITNRADPEANRLAKRHYTCQTTDSKQFMPPGSCLVLKVPPGLAVWGTSWPLAEFVKHAWGGAWVCSIFRSEGAGIASDLIREAVAATRWFYGEPPTLGMVTFIDRTKVHPIKRRGRDTWGYTYELAGFVPVGETKGGLLALQLLPDAMPEPEPPIGAALKLAI